MLGGVYFHKINFRDVWYSESLCSYRLGMTRKRDGVSNRCNYYYNEQINYTNSNLAKTGPCCVAHFNLKRFNFRALYPIASQGDGQHQSSASNAKLKVAMQSGNQPKREFVILAFFLS